MHWSLYLNGLIPAMTVGITLGVTPARACDRRIDNPAITETPAHRLVCRMRPGSEARVRATAESIGLGGSRILTAALAAPDKDLEAVLLGADAIELDSPISWDFADPALAHDAALARYVVITAPLGTGVEELHAALAARTDLFELVEFDGLGSSMGVEAPNDPHFALQYGLSNSGAAMGGIPGVPHADIHALEAWGLAGGAVITIAVLDTGVSQSHPDLAAKLVPGRNFVGSDPDATDDSTFVPHGTACAGIAAASANDGVGISGVSWTGRIMPVRIADQWGNSSELACANGIIWAVDHGARVISISLGYTTGTSYLRSAVTYASASGAVIVAAAGNTPTAPVYFPARLPEVIAVTATDNRDALATFSTTGPEVDVAAPGVMIFTTTDSSSLPNGYRFETGTSMAAPFVSGIAALLLETAPWLSSSEVRRIIRDTADDRGPAGWDPGYGAGRVNAAMALASLAGEDQVCAADWDGDGLVTSADLFAFLTDYFAGHADVNGDGRTSSADLLEFVNRFMAGC